MYGTRNQTTTEHYRRRILATETAAIGRGTGIHEAETSNSAGLRWTAVAAILGSLLMVAGAAVWSASGADLDLALQEAAMTGYLVDAAEQDTLLVVNLSLWIFGAISLGIAGTALAVLGERTHPATAAARLVYTGGAALAVAAFVTWLALVRLAGNVTDPASVEPLADALGFIASRADWIATVLLVGVGPALLSFAGRDTWVPRWLAAWSFLTLIAAVLTTVAMFAGGLSTYGFVIVPVGLGWTIGAGVVALRTA